MQTWAKTTGRRRAVLLALPALVIALLAVRDFARLGDQLPWRAMYDFPQFYCSGAALDEGASPYTYEPLHACERRVSTSALLAANPQMVLPAPLPPYDFLPLRWLAKLDYASARATMFVASCAALVGAVVALAGLGLPADVVVLAFLLSAGYVDLAAGQIVPIALLFLVLCGSALAARRDAFAGIAATLAAIEPHLALPVVVVVFVYVKGARVAMAATAAVLGIVSLSTMGLAQCVTYFTRILPLQGSAETSYPFQFSLTYLLNALGIPEAAALAVGAASTLALLGLAVMVAPRVAGALERRELLAFFPAVCGITAGTYMHMVDLCFAIPAALVFAATLRGRRKVAASLALSLLSIPWVWVWSIKKLFLASIFVAAAILLRLEMPWMVVVPALLALCGAMYGLELHPPTLAHALRPSPSAFPADSLSEPAYRVFIEQVRSGDPRWVLVKVPAWTALVTLLGLAIDVARPAFERLRVGSAGGRKDAV
ncbi:MAG: hypothetical protein JOY98_07870 [Candidatus Eremiobacteraeota bacterium]|nr:hypothetical protein [Candidatus Eremiobacteraeota bacterium]